MTVLQKHLIFIPLCLIAFAGFFGFIVMLLWNWLLPDLFHLPELSYCQAVGLLLLCKILFGSFGGCHHGHAHGHAHCGGNKLRERWNNMTAEEREQFIEAHKSISNASDTDCNGK